MFLPVSVPWLCLVPIIFIMNQVLTRNSKLNAWISVHVVSPLSDHHEIRLGLPGHPELIQILLGLTHDQSVDSLVVIYSPLEVVIGLCFANVVSNVRWRSSWDSLSCLRDHIAFLILASISELMMPHYWFLNWLIPWAVSFVFASCVGSVGFTRRPFLNSKHVLTTTDDWWWVSGALSWILLSFTIDSVFCEGLSCLLSVSHEGWWWSKLLLLALSGLGSWLLPRMVGSFNLLHLFLMGLLRLMFLNNNIGWNCWQFEFRWLNSYLTNLGSFIFKLILASVNF